MSTSKSGGVSRVLAKLSVSLEKGNYYEAHQMYRTLYFRYTNQKKYEEVLTMLFEGASKFLDFDQKPIAADLSILLVETLEKMSDVDAKLWTQNVTSLIRRIGPSVVERETLLTKTIKWVNTRPPSELELLKSRLHQRVAGILWDEGSLEQAKHHFLLSHDGVGFARMLIQLSSKGFAREIDLFIAHIVLQQLCLKQKEVAGQTFETYTKYHPKIACTEPPFNLPLLNFIYFLLKAIETAKLGTFRALCDLYKPSIDRDPNYDKCLQKIGVIFFNAPQPRPAPGPGGIFGDLINQLFQGLEDHDEPGDGHGSDGDLD